MIYIDNFATLGTKTKRKISSPGNSAPPSKQLAQSKQQQAKQETRATTSSPPLPPRTPPPQQRHTSTSSACDDVVVMPSPVRSAPAVAVTPAAVTLTTHTQPDARDSRDNPPPSASAAAAGGAAASATAAAAVASGAPCAASSRIPVRVTHIDSINKFYIVPVNYEYIVYYTGCGVVIVIDAL